MPNASFVIDILFVCLSVFIKGVFTFAKRRYLERKKIKLETISSSSGSALVTSSHVTFGYLLKARIVYVINTVLVFSSWMT